MQRTLTQHGRERASADLCAGFPPPREVRLCLGPPAPPGVTPGRAGAQVTVTCGYVSGHAANALGAAECGVAVAPQPRCNPDDPDCPVKFSVDNFAGRQNGTRGGAMRRVIKSAGYGLLSAGLVFIGIYFLGAYVRGSDALREALNP